MPVVDLPPSRLLAEGAVGTLADALHVHLLAGEREAVRVELREVEDVADEPLEARRLGRDHVERRALVTHEPLAQRLDVTADRGQRGAQLVRDRHEEVPLALLGLGEARGHLPQPVGEVPDLAASRHARDLDVAPAVGDVVGDP